MENWLLNQAVDRGWDNKVFKTKNVCVNDSASENSEISEEHGRKGTQS